MVDGCSTSHLQNLAKHLTAGNSTLEETLWLWNIFHVPCHVRFSLCRCICINFANARKLRLAQSQEMHTASNRSNILLIIIGIIIWRTSFYLNTAGCANEWKFNNLDKLTLFLPLSLTNPLLPLWLCFCCTICEKTNSPQMREFYRRQNGFADIYLLTIRSTERRNEIKLTQISQSCCQIFQPRKCWVQSQCPWWRVGRKINKS